MVKKTAISMTSKEIRREEAIEGRYLYIFWILR